MSRTATRRLSDGFSPVAKKPKMANGGAHSNGLSPRQSEIDEDLHSRQLAVYGRSAMRRMALANVLIVGANGLGVEAAKNIILAGVKAVTLHDQGTVQLRDLAAQFYLQEADVGRNRAEACRDRLQELNIAVTVSSSTEELSEAFLKRFQTVILSGAPLEEAVRINSITHSAGIPLIYAEARGVFARVFSDFGDSFTVVDTDGEEPHTGIIAGITDGRPSVVTCVEDERLQFQDGDEVVFSEVEGMSRLNDGKPRRVKNCKANAFELEEYLSGYEPYQRGGIVTQHKTPKQLAFKALQAALKDPGELMLTDFSKIERPAQLHLGFQALDAFQEQHGRLPKPYDSKDAEALVEHASSLGRQSGREGDVDKDVLSKLSWTAAGELSPMAAIFGGIVGQEAMKAISGKFHPIHQFLYFDAVEALPASPPSLPDLSSKGDRYHGQTEVFGPAVQQQLSQLRVFLVGAGALGCEFIKNFAMMGVSTSSGGLVTVTDDDVIEKSNLSRQFLFRDWNIGSAKSEVASKAAKALNPAMNVRALQSRVSPDSENIFDDDFWGNVDVVVNALDNVDARLYVDARCVYFGKPLLESGTLGPKCNTQMVIPILTENYGSSRDPPEKQAPMCTLRSFPHNISHCLTFARSEFEGLLEKAPAEANAFLTSPAKYLAAIRQASDASAREQLEKVVELLVEGRCQSFEECIAWARRLFQVQFHDRIAQLVFTFPEDATTSSGNLFWSAPKRFPRAIGFDARDPVHASFAQAAAILKAQSYRLPIPDWAQSASQVADAAAALDIPQFRPQHGVQIETDPKATASKSSDMVDDEAQIEQMVQRLEASAKQLPQGFMMDPVVFEKDDDTNFHMDLITALANMRARNYSIPEVDKLKAKLIAGKIIPAIATTTAMATGLVCLELYKVLQKKAVEDFRNTFANLAVPLFAMSEPLPPKAFKFQDMSWTLWDRWVLEGDLSVQDVLEWFRKKGLEAYSMSTGQTLLYNNIFPKHRERLGRKLSDLVQTVAKQEIPANRKHFDVLVACEDAEGEDLDVPLVSIKFR